MNNLFERVSEILQNNNIKISFVESCTGGALVSALVSVPGASSILEQSFVTYSENAKMKYVGVKKDTIDKYSVYSEEVSKEMCEGLFNETFSDICVSITGKCGDNSSPAGFAFICIKYNDNISTFLLEEKGNREEVRKKFVIKTYQKILEILEN